MSLPEFNFGTVFLLLAAWTCVAIVVGMLIGECIHDADERAEHDADDTWLADQPTEILSVAEIDRRIERFESQLRHPSSWEGWA